MDNDLKDKLNEILTKIAQKHLRTGHAAIVEV